MKVIRYLLVAITAAVSATAQGGEVIAGPEFTLPFSASAVVRGPGEYLVVGSDDGAVRAVRVSAGGELLGSPITVFNKGPGEFVGNVSAAWNGNVYLVVWSSQFSSGSFFQTSSFIRGVRLNAAGEVLDAEPIQIASAQTSEEGCSYPDGGNFPFCRYLYSPVATGNGSRFLIAWKSLHGPTPYEDVQGVQLDADGALQGEKTTLVAWAWNSSLLSAASNGTAYLLAFKFQTRTISWVADVYVVPTDDGLLVSPGGASSYDVTEPVVASDGSEFLVAWHALSGPEGEGWLSLPVSSDGIHGARTLVWPDPSGSWSWPSGQALTFEGAEYLLIWFGERDAAGVSPLSALRISREGTRLDPEPQSLPASTLSGWPPPTLASGGKGASLLVYGPRTRLILTDSTPPVVNVPEAMAVTATSVSGAVVEFEATATDDYAGLLVPACSPASGTQFPPGATQVTCFAHDEAGNVGTAAFTVRVAFAWSGVLQPMNPDGSSVFKLGRTVPIKFQLVGASANVTNLAAALTVRKVADGVLGSVEEAISTSAADYGNHFRYDAVGATYIFNLATGGLSAGTYEARIDMNDGIERAVMFSLRP